MFFLLFAFVNNIKHLKTEIPLAVRSNVREIAINGLRRFNRYNPNEPTENQVYIGQIFYKASDKELDKEHWRSLADSLAPNISDTKVLFINIRHNLVHLVDPISEPSGVEVVDRPERQQVSTTNTQMGSISNSLKPKPDQKMVSVSLDGPQSGRQAVEIKGTQKGMSI